MTETPTEMKTIVTIQQAHRMDGMNEQYQPRYQLPYPFHVDVKGNICQQDLWQGQVLKVVGLRQNYYEQVVDLFWSEKVFAEPEQMIGMYLVTVDKDGTMSGFNSAVESVLIGEVPVDF